MLRIHVTNESGEERTWFVEPYGDEVALAPSEVLEIEVAGGPNAALRIDLRPAGAVVWIEGDGEVLLPSDLLRNGVSLWPSA